jgi:hypothetical protein
MSHPYRKFEGTRMWVAVEAALNQLAQNKDVTLHTTREHVVGFLCEQLERQAKSGGGPVDIDKDTALVLFDLLASRNDLPEALKLEAPERNALWWLQATLEERLSEPFSPEYASLLEAARKTMIERGGE